MTQNQTGRIALLFAEGERLIDCRIVDELPVAGQEIELYERDTHTRSTEHCTRPCCAVEPKAQYHIVSLTAIEGEGWDGLNRAIDNREWVEGQCRRHEWCSLFDSYSVAGYLRLEPPFEEMPVTTVIVEVRCLKS